MANSRYKFRAWDKKGGRWIHHEESGLLFLNFETISGGVFHLHDESGTGKDYYEIMQFTGIQDKNGVDIYEGDIVELEVISDFPGEYGVDINYLYTGEVTIVPSKGVCLKRPTVVDRLEDKRQWKCDYNKPIVAYRSKVISNVYENPELIKETT